MTPLCKFKHSYKKVNNPYKNGKPDITGNDWVTEVECEYCDTRPPKEVEESLLAVK